MAPFDNDTRTSKTPRKRTATTTGETPARKRASTTRKKTTETAPLEAAPKDIAASPSPARTSPAPAAVTAAAKSPMTSVAAPAKSPMSAAATTTTSRAVPVATGSRPDPGIAKVVDADERMRMIAEAAYHKFLVRGPGNGTPIQDWFEAEAEIDALLAEQQTPRTQ